MNLSCFIFIFFSATLALTGCISPSPEVITCQQRDWYEVGRRKGASGQPLSSLEAQTEQDPCFKSKTLHALYENGYQLGLLEFCTEDNAYELGRSGQKYFHVCPAEIELSFIDSYRRGQRVYALENNNRSIDIQIQELYGQLNQPPQQNTDPSPKSSQWTDEIRQKILNLRQNRAQNKKEISKISTPAS